MHADETKDTTDTTVKKVRRTDREWRKLLTRQQYYVTREKGTERAFTGEYWNHHDEGTYHCVGCGAPLFNSEAKFNSGCGWPSFTAPTEGKLIDEHLDTSHNMRRIEVVCSRCESHLGHVFNDGPGPTGLRYCINSASLEFEKPGTASGERANRGDESQKPTATEE